MIDLRFDQSGLKEFFFLSKTAEEFCFLYKEVSLNIAESFKSYSSLFIITVAQLLSDGKIMMLVFDRSSFRVLVSRGVSLGLCLTRRFKFQQLDFLYQPLMTSKLPRYDMAKKGTHN